MADSPQRGLLPGLDGQDESVRGRTAAIVVIAPAESGRQTESRITQISTFKTAYALLWLWLYNTTLRPRQKGWGTVVAVVVVLETTRPLDSPTYDVDSRWVVCVLRAPPLGGRACVYLHYRIQLSVWCGGVGGGPCPRLYFHSGPETGRARMACVLSYAGVSKTG